MILKSLRNLKNRHARLHFEKSAVAGGRKFCLINGIVNFSKLFSDEIEGSIVLPSATGLAVIDSFNIVIAQNDCKMLLKTAFSADKFKLEKML